MNRTRKSSQREAESSYNTKEREAKEGGKSEDPKHSHAWREQRQLSPPSLQQKAEKSFGSRRARRERRPPEQTVDSNQW